MAPLHRGETQRQKVDGLMQHVNKPLNIPIERETDWKSCRLEIKWRNVFFHHWKSSSAKLVYQTGAYRTYIRMYTRINRRGKRKEEEINSKSARALPGTRYARKKARKRSLRPTARGKKSLFADRSRLGRDFNALVSYCGRGPSTPYQLECSAVCLQLLFPIFTQKFFFPHPD